MCSWSFWRIDGQMDRRMGVQLYMRLPMEGRLTTIFLKPTGCSWRWFAVDFFSTNNITASFSSSSATINGKMVNGSRFYRALESVSVASALSTALTIYPCQIRVHQRLTVLSSQLLTTARKKEWWPATADSLPQAVTCQLWNTLRGGGGSNLQPSDC